ncbi:MAG: sigma-70 family RNA polymerase sigma factor [Paludibacteraceae bacterium]|nr:sigma-70 family RNA polymerase sigma factor [Paludibacteraceae bacterium]
MENNKIFTLEEIFELITKSQAGDVEAKKSLIQYHTRFVSSVAKRYLGNGLSFEELQENGLEGLSHAIDVFDKSRGFKFAPYAIWWIRQSILQALKHKDISN